MRRTLTTVMALFGLATVSFAYSTGPPAGYCGNNGVYCTACHTSFPLNSGDGSLSLSTLTEYTPGDTYTLQVDISDPGQQRWGFQITAENGAGGFAGTWALTEPSRTQIIAQHYVEHTSAGTNPGQLTGNTWTMQWTAPAAGTGDVTFFLASNAANGNGTNQGDYIYAITMMVPEAAPALYGLTTTGINTVIPAQGGNVTYSIDFFTHLQQSFQNVNYWTRITMPDNTLSGVLFTTTANIPPHADIHIPLMVQSIPAMAPAGQYLHHAYLGFYPNAQLEDTFTFIKTAAGADNAPAVYEWQATGPWPDPAAQHTTPVELPDEYAVGAAYPNPFNTMTSVSVTLPESADLTLRVFNVMGEQVAELHHGVIAAGAHEFNFDASRLGSGLYFIQAVVPGHLNQMQKVTLVK